MSLFSQNKRQGDGSPVLRKRLESASKSKLNSVQMPESEQESQDPDSQETQQPGNEPFYLEYVFYKGGMVHKILGLVHIMVLGHSFQFSMVRLFW